jgi:hypothetical protein
LAWLQHDAIDIDLTRAQLDAIAWQADDPLLPVSGRSDRGFRNAIRSPRLPFLARTGISRQDVVAVAIVGNIASPAMLSLCNPRTRTTRRRIARSRFGFTL